MVWCGVPLSAFSDMDAHLLDRRGEAGDGARIRQQPRHQAVIQCHVQRRGAADAQLGYELRHLHLVSTATSTLALQTRNLSHGQLHAQRCGAGGAQLCELSMSFDTWMCNSFAVNFQQASVSILRSVPSGLNWAVGFDGKSVTANWTSSAAVA